MKTKLPSGLFDWRTVKLTPQDFDFRQCPKWQLDACCTYEIGREFVSLREAVASDRRKPKEAVTWWDCESRDPKLVEFTEWPNKPWLAIPAARRQRWIVEACGASDPSRLLSGGTRKFRGIVNSASVKNLCNEFGVYEDHAAASDGSATFHVLAVHWKNSNKELLADFAVWLKQNRPEDTMPPDNRERLDKQLMAFGARRLFQVGGKDAAMAKLHFTDEAHFWKTKAKADAYLKRFA